MAEQFKGTPGPWFATTRRGSWDWLVASEADPNIEICQMFHDGTDMNEIGEANAKLVAAAHDMLTELKNLLECIELAERNGEMILPLAGYGKVHLEKARAAVAKAESK